MATRAFEVISVQKVAILPRQMRKGPAELANIEQIDKTTGLITDAFMVAAWDPALHHVMFNLPVVVKQVETKQVHLQSGGDKLVTNILISNHVVECQITGWEKHAEKLAALKEGVVNYKTKMVKKYMKFSGIPLHECIPQGTRRRSHREYRILPRIPLRIQCTRDRARTSHFNKMIMKMRHSTEHTHIHYIITHFRAIVLCSPSCYNLMS